MPKGSGQERRETEGELGESRQTALDGLQEQGNSETNEGRGVKLSKATKRMNGLEDFLP